MQCLTGSFSKDLLGRVRKIHLTPPMVVHRYQEPTEPTSVRGCLAYPRFDLDPHPTLSAAVTANLWRLTIDLRGYARSTTRVPHRKRNSLLPDRPWRAFYGVLTRAELRVGLCEHPERIGTMRSGRRPLPRIGSAGCTPSARLTTCTPAGRGSAASSPRSTLQVPVGVLLEDRQPLVRPIVGENLWITGRRRGDHVDQRLAAAPARAGPVGHGTGSRIQILIEAMSMVPRYM
jgi:hypothetical protein